MAGPRTRRSPCQNPPPPSKDELAEAPTESTSIPFPVVSWAQTPAPAPNLAPAPASALSLPGTYTDVNLQRATKLTLELFVKGQCNGLVTRPGLFIKEESFILKSYISYFQLRHLLPPL